MASRVGSSAASRVFVVLLACVVTISAVLATLLAVDAQNSERADAEALTLSLANTLARTPSVIEAMSQPDTAASAALEPYALSLIDATPVDFITLMRPDGIRLTHPDPAQIGKPYLGTIAAAQQGGTITEEFTGTLGPSVRSVVPVEADGEILGLAAVGVTVSSLGQQVWARMPFVLGLAAVLTALGIAAALAARRFTRRLAGDLPTSEVRDAVSSYESVRTLGEALRAQTHEHGNRMHTAVALLELGRTQEAIDILTETSRQSQELVDQVAARRDGDPTVGALLLGKAAQARERGVGWDAEIDPLAPRSTLSGIDGVSVVGNLIDNALDAASVGDEPRWVRVVFARAGGGALEIRVSDSGPGISADVGERIFEHGYSSKPAGTTGRGVGLALVRSLVEAAGGAVDYSNDPTTFQVILPGRLQ
ncbi:GHKL domain-containing protein [Microbacterium schleiferi]|uniref:histidine kinase n=1 Tax=Microbacterium schleiferi TaxID=69362 RepID=A0A7S8RI53_9MICO|nr:ATP-binding protein [Microbacterium schleiferi]QPE05392.1 GHKL domain-containing protein [Microbacterium schleiferi]